MTNDDPARAARLQMLEELLRLNTGEVLIRELGDGPAAPSDNTNQPDLHERERQSEPAGRARGAPPA